MEQITTSIFFRELTYSNSNIKKMEASLKHSLRIDNDNINWNSSLSGNNTIKIFNETTQQFDIFTKEEIAENKQNILDTFLLENEEQIKTQKFNRDTINATKKIHSRFKEAFTRYAKTKNKNIEETNLFNKLLEEIKTKNITANYVDTIINEFKNIKVKSYNSKLKRLEEFKLYLEQNKQDNSKEVYGDNKIRYIETIFKIPNLNNIELSAEETTRIAEDFYKEHFKEFKIKMIFEHKDEISNFYKNNKKIVKTKKELGQHSHLFLRTTNYTATKYKKIFDYLKDTKLLEIAEVEKLIGTNDNQQTKEQKKNMGFYYQEIIYDFANNHSIFKSKNLLAQKYVNLSNDEVVRNEVKNEMSREGRKKTQDRLHNGATFKEEVIEHLKTTIQEQEKVISDLTIQTSHLEEKSHIIKDSKVLSKMIFDNSRGEDKKLKVDLVKANIENTISEIILQKEDTNKIAELETKIINIDNDYKTIALKHNNLIGRNIELNEVNKQFKSANEDLANDIIKKNIVIDKLEKTIDTLQEYKNKAVSFIKENNLYNKFIGLFERKPKIGGFDSIKNTLLKNDLSYNNRNQPTR